MALNKTHRTIVIVGAGMAGLTLAIALQRRGFDVEIFEAAEEMGEVGAGVSLFANGTRLLHRLGLESAINEVSSDPTALIFRRGLTGEQFANVPLTRGDWYRDEFGSRYTGIHRQDLQRILLDALQPGTIQLGKRVVNVLAEGPGRYGLRFGDGSTRSADLVVAADGIRSILRTWMTGGDDRVVFSGTSGFRGVVPISEVPSLPDPTALTFWTGEGAHVLHFPMGPDYEYITFLAVVENPKLWPDPNFWRIGATNEEAEREFVGWHPAMTELIGAVPHADRWGLFGVGPLETWSKGNVVLMGDSAHGMLPHHGQGANQGLEDAVALADLLIAPGDLSLSDRLDIYERVRKPRTSEVQKTVWKTNYWLHIPEGGVEEETRAELFSQLPRSLRWMHEYDVQTDVEGVLAQGAMSGSEQ